MRFYCLTNMYLSSIQHGIQSAHCLHDMILKYRDDTNVANANLYEWMSAHKTMVILNGGTSDDLHAFTLRLQSDNIYDGLAWGTFNEPSIGNALTCVGVILPERFYNITLTSSITDTELELAYFLSTKHLAR